MAQERAFAATDCAICGHDVSLHRPRCGHGDCGCPIKWTAEQRRRWTVPDRPAPK